MAQRAQKQSKESKNIKVFIRIRPNPEPTVPPSQCVYPIDDHQIRMMEKESGSEPPVFHFDQILSESATQLDIFNVVGKSIIENALEGINGTIFCYGQTSSGKTYTCIGSDLVEESQRGILVRAIEEIHQRTRFGVDDKEYKMKISMIEIYNEKIRDLMHNGKTELKIRSSKSQGIFLEGATEKYIYSTEESNFYISKALEHRSMGYTNQNFYSSRSHFVAILTLHQHDLRTGQLRSSKITLVDLAGSQKLMRTGAEGKILEEAKKINTSLSALGKVIYILSEGKKSHVPYRDSKLTRLLQESLGGNSITSLIINISPAVINEHQTLSSLRFGFRAKAIKNDPRVNKQYTVGQLLSLLGKSQKKNREQTELIALLMKQKGFTSLSPEQFINLYVTKVEELREGADSAEQQSDKPSTIKIKCNNFGTQYMSDLRRQLDLQQIQQKESPQKNHKSQQDIERGYFHHKSEKQLHKSKHSSTQFLEPFNNDFRHVAFNLDSDEETSLHHDKFCLGISDGKSMGEHQFKSQKFALESKIFDLKLGLKGFLEIMDDDQKDEISRETNCKSDAENQQIETQKQYQKRINGSLEENLQQIRKNLEKIRKLGRTRKNEFVMGLPQN